MRRARLAALAESPAAFASTVSRELGFDEAEWRRRAGASVWFLAWRDGEPVGMVASFAEGGQDPPGSWHLVGMWVSPEARGSGVADQLVQAVAGHARAAGSARLTLWVADGNARAMAFYRRLGFRPSGARQTYRRQDGTELDEQELVLGPREPGPRGT